MSSTTATCALGHTWETSGETRNVGTVRAEGKRPRAHFETFLEAPRCPECGGNCWRLIPSPELRAAK